MPCPRILAPLLPLRFVIVASVYLVVGLIDERPSNAPDATAEQSENKDVETSRPPLQKNTKSRRPGGSVAEALQTKVSECFDDERCVSVDILFGSSRYIRSSGVSDEEKDNKTPFTDVLSEDLMLGTVTVSVPAKNRKLGQINRPVGVGAFGWSASFDLDPDHHFVLVGL